ATPRAVNERLLSLFIDPASVIVNRQVIFKVDVLEPPPLEDRQGRASLEVFILPRNRGIKYHLCFSDETPIHQFSSPRDRIVSMGFDIPNDVDLLGGVTPGRHRPIDLVHIKYVY